MKKYIIFLLMFFLLPISAAHSVEKPCSKRQKGIVKNNLTCTKVTKYRYLWIKVNKEKEYEINKKPVNNEIKDNISLNNYEICGEDYNIPSEWKKVQDFFISNNLYCNPVYRIEEKTSYYKNPLTKEIGNQLPLNECKIKRNKNKPRTIAWPQNDELDWWNSSRHPSPSTIYQVVPIYSLDSGKPTESPVITYGKYFNFIEKWTKYSSDVESNVRFNIHNEYIKIPENFSDYSINHIRTDQTAAKINNMFAKYVDDKINFSGTNFTIFVVPPTTDPKLVEQVGLGRMKTNEGTVISAIFPPLNLDKNLGYDYMKFMLPSWWLHQMMHVGIGFDDNKQNWTPDGTNEWGLMNGASAGDLFIWQKWLAGFIDDSQVSCFDISENFISWIRPSTYKVSENKMTIIKISDSKIIFFESIRPYGLNYKIDKKSIGVRVYLVDTSIINDSDSIMSVTPQNRVISITRHLNEDASFKVGDYFLYNKKKISIIESGEFGDIIKVEDIGL